MKRRERRKAWKVVCHRAGGLPPGLTPRAAWLQYKLEPKGRK